MGAHNSKAQIVATITTTHTDPMMPSLRSGKGGNRGKDDKQGDETAAPQRKKPRKSSSLKSPHDATTVTTHETDNDETRETDNDEEDVSTLGESLSQEQLSMMVDTLQQKTKDMEGQLAEKDNVIERLRTELSTRLLKEKRRRNLAILPEALVERRALLVITCTRVYQIVPILPKGWHLWSEEEGSFPQRILVGMGLNPRAEGAQRIWDDHIREFVHDKFRKKTSDVLRKMFLAYTRECHEGSVCHSATCAKPCVPFRNLCRTQRRISFPLTGEMDTSSDGQVAWPGEDMETTIDEWSAADPTHKDTVYQLLRNGEARRKILVFAMIYGTQVKAADAINESFSKSKPDQEADAVEASQLEASQQDKRKGVFDILSPGEVGLAAVLFMNNDHAHGWSKRYESRHEKKSDRTGCGKWNIKGGKRKFAIGMEPKAMTMHEQVKLLCEAMRKNEELMAALRVESLNWWDEQHGAEEKKSKRKSVLKDENCGYYMEPSDVPKCPPLDGTGYKPYDPEAWMADIETTATNTEPI